jgi:hypothetical protein
MWELASGYDGVSTGSGSDRVSSVVRDALNGSITRSLPLPVLTSFSVES